MLLTIILFLESAIHLTTSQPASPCPSVFQYQLDEKGIWWGMVLVTPVPSNVLLKVSVEMFVHASLPSKYAGKLLLKDGKEKVAERIVRGDSQPIVYQILFPTQNPLPVINKITANEKRICIGSQVAATRAAMCGSIGNGEGSDEMLLLGVNTHHQWRLVSGHKLVHAQAMLPNICVTYQRLGYFMERLRPHQKRCRQNGGGTMPFNYIALDQSEFIDQLKTALNQL
uniref:Serine protease gd N-terminal domain-containing protein n=1 Tax=Timema cristinae TaxID=61476 RepID=A0A7R9CE62_TIMCR|nr:unnamed protein product [Timema cristinae]